LLLPLFIVLKETNDRFGPRVEENLFRPTNVIIKASQSGKMTSGINFFITFIFYLTIYNNKSYKKASKLTFIFLVDLFKMWLEEAYFPNIGSDSVLLIDSWTEHCLISFRI